MPEGNKRSRFEWNDVALEILRSGYGSVAADVLAERIGCTVSAVYQAANKRGIRKLERSVGNPGIDGYPIGHVRRDRHHGFYEKKIAATGNRRSDWRRLDLLEWEEKNGPVPEGFIVYCPPGLERTPENLSIRRAKISTEEKELLHLKAEFSRRIAELKRLSRTPVALTTPQPCQTYTAADDALIEQLCDTHTHAQIAERLGRSTKSVGNRIYRLQGKR
ncbi:hypothetical protein QRO08_09605 [Paracidovorax citrulli]|nr:hypothetical protein [Paracidovorax citrulli]WIY40446.1 hypothetical protein QRO10_05755 [Paracidovorax citrulli]WIY42318.1 hypothetical protein QRO12_15265 [Paracidovorax citrulli]WIY50793.1 hypothetical protein QRO08_09605 [Paracidovorax citrulli]